MEQEHFEKCLEIIKKNIMYYKKKVEKGKQEIENLYQSGLIDQLSVYLDIQEHLENTLRKNKAALQKPYFGRIDYQEEESNQKESLYIGKNGIFQDKTEIIIVDWRAPVSALYYENELGKGNYNVPEMGSVSVDLQLKRTFDIQQGKLLGYFDQDVAATDELLINYLAQNKDAVLGDIISTIQKEQNEIIRETPFTNIIVQGVAGSGKTTVAMHRISYILYNYEKKFPLSTFCIIGSNDMLLNYITSGLPDLDVHDMKQKRMDLFFCDLLGKEWKKNYVLTELQTAEAWKSKLDFARDLERYLQNIRDYLLPIQPIIDLKIGEILSRESLQNTRKENPNYSVHQIFKLLNERLKTKIQFLTSEEENYQKEKLKEYKNYFHWKSGQKDLVKIYLNFLEEYANTHQIEIKSLIERIKKRTFDLYDVAALCLIQKRITQQKMQDNYKQIVIDEAQDFGVMVYYVLKQILEQCYFTIMGDVSQNINYETGINEWEELRNSIFHSAFTKFHILAKSYRNTIEISEYAGKILEKASFGAYKIQPVLRHGREVSFYDTKNLGKKTAEIIKEIRHRNYHTIGVICRTVQEAEEATTELEKYIPSGASQYGHAADLQGIPSRASQYGHAADSQGMNFQKGIMVLPIQFTKGLEFDGVILWNPSDSAYQEQEKDAKLLYVAITRALHELHIVYKDKLSQFFLF